MEKMKQTKEIIQTFDELSERYESWYSQEKGKIIKETELLAIKKLIPKGKGLEVGIGSGIFASELRVEFGIDPSEKLLQKAHSRNLKVALGIGEKLPFKSETFDFSLFVVTLSFLTDPKKALQEAQRILKPKGNLIVCFIPKNSPWGKHYRKKKSEGHDFYKYTNFYEILQVKNLLKNLKFELKETTSTLYQKPDSIKRIEDPKPELSKSGGFCCIKAEKI